MAAKIGLAGAILVGTDFFVTDLTAGNARLMVAMTLCIKVNINNNIIIIMILCKPQSSGIHAQDKM